MLLGDLFTRLDDERTAEELLLATGDLAVIATVREGARRAETSVGDYLGETVGHFVQRAGSDQWMAAVTAASRSDNPGAACLLAILRTTGGPGHSCGH